MRKLILLLVLSQATLGCRRTSNAEQRDEVTPVVTLKESPSASLPSAASSHALAPPPGPPPMEPLILDLDQSEAWGGLKTEAIGHDVSTAKNIVVLFHGYGALGDDLLPLALELNESLGQGSETAFLLPAAPFLRPPGGRAWFRRDRSNFEEGLLWAQKLMDAIFDRNASARVVMGGFSQGAMITVNLLRDAKESVAGAMVLSPASLIARDPKESQYRPPVFMSHGTRDGILPFQGAVELREQLTQDEFEVTWIQFDGGHAIPPPVRLAMSVFLKRVIAIEGAP